jgi:hypothetical protein
MLKPTTIFQVCLIEILLFITGVPVAAATGTPDHVLKSKFGFSISIFAKEGYYEVKQITSGAAGSEIPHGDEQSWFGTGVVSVYTHGRWFSSTGKSIFHHGENQQRANRLTLLSARRGGAQDSLGSYDFVELVWKVPGTQISVITAFDVYRDHPYLTFVQRFPQGFPGYANGDWTVPSVAFPQFVSPGWGTPQNLYSWTTGGLWSHRLAYGDAYTIQGTVEPLIVSDPGFRTIILSPFSNYLVATQQSRPLAVADTVSRGSISCGIEGLVQEVPAGFEHKHIMVFGEGIHKTFQDWGHALLTRAGKTPPSKYQDETLKYLVYMDDAGAYYWSHGFKEEGYKNYADIILGVEKEAKEHGLRIGAYHIMDDLPQRDRAEGLFEPRQDMFPDGLAKFHEELGKPLQLYIMWIKAGGPYRKKYAYYESDPGDLPYAMGDVFYTPEYWQFTADKLASWGTILLQHDFLSDYEGNRAMMSSISKMDIYFKNMAKALQAKGIDIQYCMALPRNVMESTENPVMVSLQATEDHHVPSAEPDVQTPDPDYHDPFFWKHAIFFGAFYGALGIWPSRDNIQTLADPNAFEDTLLANLLGGSIQLGHRIGECNFDLLKKTYRDGDELILKPDRPIVPIDRCYHSGCALAYTESDKGGRTWYYVLSLPAAGFTSEFSPSDLGATGEFAVYDWDSARAVVLNPDSSLALAPRAKHQYFVVAPILRNEMAVFGDVSKFVSMADQRIASVDEEEQAISVGVIADSSSNPMISGYSPKPLGYVSTSGSKLEEVSSLARLKTVKDGWFWDHQTKLWHVKLDFSDSNGYSTKSFQIGTAQ